MGQDCGPPDASMGQDCGPPDASMAVLNLELLSLQHTYVNDYRRAVAMNTNVTQMYIRIDA